MVWRAEWLSSWVTGKTTEHDCQCPKQSNVQILYVECWVLTITIFFPIHLQVVLVVIHCASVWWKVYPLWGCQINVVHFQTIPLPFILCSSSGQGSLNLYNSWDKLMELCSCPIFAVKDPFQWRNLDTGVFGTIALVRSWWIYFGRILFHLPLEGFPGVLLVRLFCGVSDGSYDVVVGLPSLTRLTWTWGFFL